MLSSESRVAPAFAGDGLGRQPQEPSATLRGAGQKSAGLAAVSPSPAPPEDKCKPPDVFADPVGSFLLTDSTGRTTFDLGNYDRCVNQEYRATLNVSMDTAYCVLEVQGVTFGVCMPMACGSTRSIRNVQNGLWGLWLVETIPTLLVITQEAEGVTASCVTGPDRGPHEQERLRWAQAALAGLGVCMLLCFAGTVAAAARLSSRRSAEELLRKKVRRLEGAMRVLVGGVAAADAAASVSVPRPGTVGGFSSHGKTHQVRVESSRRPGRPAGAGGGGHVPSVGLRIRAPHTRHVHGLGPSPGTGTASGAQSDSAESSGGSVTRGASASSRIGRLASSKSVQEALVLSTLSLRRTQASVREVAAQAAYTAAS